MDYSLIFTGVVVFLMFVFFFFRWVKRLRDVYTKEMNAHHKLVAEEMDAHYKRVFQELRRRRGP